MANLLSERIKPYVERIETQAARGDSLAQQIINLYEMWRAVPNDPGSHGLCEGAFVHWLHREGITNG